MLKRSFTKVESALILLFVIVLMGLLYYQFIYKWQKEQIAKYDTTEIEQQITLEQAKAARIRAMQEEIDENQSDALGTVETYNNIKAEINELNDIFGDAPEFTFGFDQAVATGDAVRRRISGSFKADNYREAKEMLTQLHDCKYRCLIEDINVTGGNSRNLNMGPVNVSFTVTFYETLQGAETTDGLRIEKAGDDSGGSELLDKLSASKTELENM